MPVSRPETPSSRPIQPQAPSCPTILTLLLAFLLTALGSPAHSQAIPVHPGATLPGFAGVDQIIQQAVDAGAIPGAVLLVGHNDQIFYRKAYGYRSIEPAREPMTVDTIFDLASLTKCLATATAVMQLVEQGRIRLNDPVAAYLPEFAQNGKQDITIRQMLTHFSGLRPDLDNREPWLGRDTAYKMVMAEKPANPPGSRFVYSDINFETLGFVVEKVTGTSLDQYALQHIYQPLGMKDTRFLPPADWLPRIAPTQYEENGKMLRGTVHDPTARRMGGVAGHAGLFSTADDMALYAEDLLHRFKILSRLTVQKMTTPQQPATSTILRGLGWDIDSPYSSPRGELFPIGSYGHTGFTGTSIWIDPFSDTYVILLTNAVHPRGGHGVVSLRSKVATAVAATLAITPAEAAHPQLSLAGYTESMAGSQHPSSRNGSVHTGVDVLVEHQFRELHPNPAHPVKIGLVANQTAVDSRGRRTADLLANVPGLQLAAIFSPEHGIEGSLDTTAIGNSRDPATGAPIYSVYGDTDAKRRPSPAVLANLDILVYDIQDIGVRFYTYESTLGYFLEAASKARKPILVLDRSNPITGTFVQGPVADPGREAFVSYSQTPIRHGMTIGELAKLFNAERHIGADLAVVPIEGWQRNDWYDSTGELWINPSPNMRSLTEAALYPGIGMIELTNISVGRGTNTPFELVGAPWIALAPGSTGPVTLANYLNARQIPGIRFIPTSFTPTSGPFANQPCGGVSLLITDRDLLDAPELGLEIAAALLKLYPSQYKIAGLDTLMVSKSSLAALAAGQDPRRIAQQWQDQIDQFQTIRARYLLY